MFTWIQILRGVAASMVVCYHYAGLQANRGVDVPSWLQQFGASGVDIFFVISGFIMMMSQLDTGGAAAKRFLLRRAARIVPLYWVLTPMAFLAAVLVSPGGLTAERGVVTLGRSLLFLPYDRALTSRLDEAYVLPMAWTLTFEWFFYLIFALALVLGLSTRVRVVFMAATFGVCAALGLWFKPASALLHVVSSPLAFEFVLGCVVALLYSEGIRIKPVQAVASAAVASVALSRWPQESELARAIVWGCPAFVVVAAATLANVDRYAVGLRPLVRLGDISYSLYLSHWFSVAAFGKLQARVPALEDGFGIPALVMFVVVTVATAELSYRLIEEPARVMVARLRREHAPASAWQADSVAEPQSPCVGA